MIRRIVARLFVLVAYALPAGSGWSCVPDATLRPPADAGSSQAGPDDGSSPGPAPADGGPAEDAAEPGVATPRYVQGAQGAFGPAASAILTLQAAVARGDAILVAMDFDSPSVPVVTDTLGSSFAIVASMPTGSTGMYLAVAENVAGGKDAVTVTLATPPSINFEVYVHDYAGLASRGAFDVASASSGTQSGLDSMSAGPVMTSAPGELLFGYGLAGVAEAGTGFTMRLTVDHNITEDEIVGAPGLYNATATMLMGTGWQMIAAAFRPLQ
jgi:hypothetical protein